MDFAVGTHWDVGTYADQRFTSEKHGRIDRGNYYAAKTLLDGRGRRIIWGWIQEGRPQDEATAAGWSGVLSLPRILRILSDGSLGVEPVPELETLRGNHWSYMVAELNSKTGPETAEEIRSKGRRALFVETDVRKRINVQTMVDKVLAEFGRIDFLMNNAGIVKWGDAEKVTEEDWRDVIDVNLTGLFFCCQAVGRHMIERLSGRIINIASMSGLIVNRPQNQASYNASKAAVIQLTRSLAAEWARYNIRVNAIAPGYMGTPMARPFFDDPKYGGLWIDAIPMKRPGKPEELGPLAVFLASEASSYVTGATIVVDGGYTVW